MSNLETVFIKLRNDPEFKNHFKKNPQQALQEAGLQLTAAELQMIITQQNDSDDGPLSERINK